MGGLENDGRYGHAFMTSYGGNSVQVNVLVEAHRFYVPVKMLRTPSSAIGLF